MVTAFCNRNAEHAGHIIEKYGDKQDYTDYSEMLEKEKPDFVDIITPPPMHLEMCKIAADLGIHIICQKPLAPTFAEANHRGMSLEQRLQFHQAQRGPKMAELKSWLTEQIEQHKVEPNSGLGEAISYMLKH